MTDKSTLKRYLAKIHLRGTIVTVSVDLTDRERTGFQLNEYNASKDVVARLKENSFLQNHHFDALDVTIISP